MALENKWTCLSLFLNLTLGAYFIIDFICKKSQPKAKTRKKRKTDVLASRPLLNLLKPEFPFPDAKQFLYVVCFTGGPCAGKTTAINQAADYFRNKGFNVLKIPELPTLTFNSGASIQISSWTDSERYLFFTTYLSLQLSLENAYRSLASLSQEAPILILCDRGIQDDWAYMSPFLRSMVINEYGFPIDLEFNRRYDLCLHLVTAADGAEKYYELGTNNARHETAEQARFIDKIILERYSTHRKLRVVTNGGIDFEGKLQRVCSVIEEEIFGKKTKRKFRILVQETRFQTADMKKFRVQSRNLEENPKFFNRKLKTVDSGNFRIFLLCGTEKETKIRHKTVINESDVTDLLGQNRDPAADTTKTRFQFIYQNRLCQITENPSSSPFLTLTLYDTSDRSIVPDFITIQSEI